MCKGAFHSFLKALPKCEHHIHVEGSLRPSVLFELAKSNRIELPRDDEAFSSVDSLVARYAR